MLLNRGILSQDVNLLSLNTNPIGQDHWLAGFIEADGSFYIRTSKSHGKIHISFEFSIIQANCPGSTYVYRGNQEILQEIASYLSVN
jgi:hypothetical protein